MATHSLFITWGLPGAGKELKSLEEFASNVSWWGELKSSGQIEDFRTYGFLTGNMHDRSGLVIIDGSHEQIETLAESEEFRTRLDRVFLMVGNIRVYRCETGERMMTRMARYGNAAKAMGD